MFTAASIPAFLHRSVKFGYLLSVVKIEAITGHIIIFDTIESVLKEYTEIVGVIWESPSFPENQG